MYNVSENFNDDIHRFDRKINIKLAVNGEAIEKENLLKATIERAVTDGTSFTLGQTFSSKVEIELYKCDIEFKQGDRVDLSLLLEADKYQMEEPEEVPQGVYYIDKVEVNGVKIKLTAFDLFYTMEEEYSSTIEYPTTTKKLMAEITSKCGFKHDSTLEDITIVEKLEGYTAKELIGFIAGMQGKNAIINHKGEISFVDFTKVNYQLDPSSYITFTKENNYKITGVTCLFGNVGINSGDLTGNVLAFKNPWCKQSDVDRILKKFKGLTLTNANVRYIGNFGLLPSDIITLQDKEGTIHNLFISKHIISYSGGITGEIVSGCEDKADTSHYVNKIGNKKTLTELTIEQGKINAEIVDINKQANSTIEKVAQLEITAEGINQRVERTEQSITTNSNNIASANGLISTLQTGLNTTNNNLSATNNTVSNLSTQVTTNKKNIASINTTVDSITQQVGQTEEKIETIEGSITGINVNVSGIVGDITGLNNSLNTANTNISNLQSGLNTANSNITTNKNNITTANNNITTNKNNIATNKNNITNLTTTVTSTNTKVATIETNLSGITSKVTGLETTTATISKNLNELNIGARNYIKNGDFSQGSKHWSALDGVKEFGGYNCAYKTHTATTGESFICSPRVYGLGGKQITLSFLGACEGVDTKSLEIYLLARKTGSTSDYDYTPNKLTTINKNLALYSWTYTLPNDVESFYIRFDNNAQSVATTIYVTNVQIEVGNKVTDFKPSPEDVNIAIDNVYNHVDTQIIEVKNGYSSAIEILQGQINSTVEETTSIRDEITSLEGKWSTNINQTAKDITTTVTEQIKGVSDDLQEFETTVQSYMKFSSDGLELGKTGNRFKTKLTNTKLSFLDDSTEVAYISNKKMYITDAEITNQLTIGKFAFVPRANGNTSLKWIG